MINLNLLENIFYEYDIKFSKNSPGVLDDTIDYIIINASDNKIRTTEIIVTLTDGKINIFHGATNDPHWCGLCHTIESILSDVETFVEDILRFNPTTIKNQEKKFGKSKPKG